MMPISRTLNLLVLIISPLAAGCAFTKISLPISDDLVRQRWLSSIADGRTTRKDIQQLLGEPAFRFSNDRILGYRLILSDRSTEPTNDEYLKEWDHYHFDNDAVNARLKRIAEGGALVSIRDANEGTVRKLILLRHAEFGLLLFFDTQGLLSQHTFSRISGE